jgi:ubiquinone/menaquinone biosynthesis C-methylase UbiE
LKTSRERIEAMGFVVDSKSAALHEAWRRSANFRAFERMVERSIRTLLEPRPGETVVDIGCGEGDHLLLFRSLGLGTAGIDASPHMIRMASERLGSHSELRVGRAEDLPYDDNQFDIAVLINTLEFVDDPLESMREAGRVARRKVFVCAVNSLSWLSVRSKVTGMVQDSMLRQARFFSIWELKRLARMAFGEAPMEYICSRMKASPQAPGDGFLKKLWNSPRLPFGFFLGFSVSPFYTLRTAQNPLLVGKAGRGLVKGITPVVRQPLPLRTDEKAETASRRNASPENSEGI